jgi:hypothetical protein
MVALSATIQAHFGLVMDFSFRPPPPSASHR